MTIDTAARPPVWFWLVAVLALGWAGFLCFSALTVIASPGTPMPRLIAILFPVAALCWLVGALLLLARRRWALPLLVVALLAALVWAVDMFIGLPLPLLVWQTILVPATVLILGFVFVVAARVAAARGWLR